MKNKKLENALKDPEVQDAMKDLKNSLINFKDHLESKNKTQLFLTGTCSALLGGLLGIIAYHSGALCYDSFQIAQIAKEAEYTQLTKLFTGFYIGSGMISAGLGTLSIINVYNSAKNFIEFFTKKE